MFFSITSSLVDNISFGRLTKGKIIYDEDRNYILVTKDNGLHGRSYWKTYKRKGKNLEWQFDADEYMNKITNKNKGNVGKVIPIKEFNGVSGYRGF